MWCFKNKKHTPQPPFLDRRMTPCPPRAGREAKCQAPAGDDTSGWGRSKMGTSEAGSPPLAFFGPAPLIPNPMGG